MAQRPSTPDLSETVIVCVLRSMTAKSVGSGGSMGATCSASAGPATADGGRAASKACGPETCGASAAGSAVATTVGVSADADETKTKAATAANNTPTERIAMKSPPSGNRPQASTLVGDHMRNA